MDYSHKGVALCDRVADDPDIEDIEDLMTESDLEVFEKTLRSIDKEILDEDNYWGEEIQSMREYKR